MAWFNPYTYLPTFTARYVEQKAFTGWITDTMGPKHIGPNGLFSAQNGILVKDSVRTFFDVFKVSVSPDVRIFPLYYSTYISWDSAKNSIARP